jgi:hypothetical protein
LKLRDLLENQSFASYVGWAPDGESFRIYDMEKFAELVLPTVFAMRDYKSFKRQVFTLLALKHAFLSSIYTASTISAAEFPAQNLFAVA